MWSVAVMLPLLLTSPAPSSGQAKGRAVVGLPVYSGPPAGRSLVITDIRVAGEPIRVNRPFAAGDGWLRQMVVRVRNISGRPISSVKVLVTPERGRFEFTPPRGDGLGAGESQGLMPGEEAGLRLSEALLMAGEEGRAGSAELEEAKREVVRKARRVMIDAAVIRFAGESTDRLVNLLRVSGRR